MAIFTFDPPLLVPAADTPAGRKRLACWLRDRLAAQGVETFGPVGCEDGWRLAVNAENGFVTIWLDPHARGERPFTLVVEALGEADCEYQDAVAAFEHAMSAGGLEFEMTG